jgi:hypothetical protein
MHASKHQAPLACASQRLFGQLFQRYLLPKVVDGADVGDN